MTWGPNPTWDKVTLTACENDKVEQFGPFKRVILCAKCQKEKERIAGQSIGRKTRLMKERIPDPELNPTVDPEAILTSSSLSLHDDNNVQSWSKVQEKLADSLGLTIKAKDLVTYNLNCACGLPVRPTARKPKLLLCLQHFKLYQKERKMRNQQDHRREK